MTQGTLFKVRWRFRPRPLRALKRVLGGIRSVLQQLPIPIPFLEDSD